MTLVSELAGEIVASPLKVPPVEALGNLVIWDVLSILIGFLEMLSFRKNLLEFGIVFVKWLLVRRVELDEIVVLGVSLGQREGLIFRGAILSVERMALLVLAGISLPPQVHGVDLRDEKVHLI